jgi:hypothetical protein
MGGWKIEGMAGKVMSELVCNAEFRLRIEDLGFRI